jgi:Leucine-rich repeat (LRR) protein
LLHCEKNQLNTLPYTLPPALTSLFCYKNRLTTLPDTLPTGLREFYCFHNQLTTLPPIHTTLDQFWFRDNNAFPDSEPHENIYDYIDRINTIAERINTIAEAASQKRIVARCALIFEELAQKVWHPSRVERRMLLGVDMEDM